MTQVYFKGIGLLAEKIPRGRERPSITPKSLPSFYQWQVRGVLVICTHPGMLHQFKSLA